MKRMILFAVALICFSGALLLSCSNPALESATDSAAADPRAVALNLPNSQWTDSLTPVTTLTFLSNRVTLGGAQSTITSDKNWYWLALDGQTYTFEMVDDADAIRNIVDTVEDNYGTNITMPDAVILVWTDPVKRQAFQLHYYAANAAAKNYERLICWGVGNPHEFKRQQ